MYMFRFILMGDRTYGTNARSVNWFLWWFCLRFYYATQVVYFAHITHSLFLAASLVVAIQVAQAIFEVPTGVLSDRFGRVWTLRFQGIASMISIALYAVSGSYILLLCGAVFDGLWRAMMSGHNEALVYESAKLTNNLKAFPKQLASMNMIMEIGGFVSMAIGGFLAAQGFAWALWITFTMHIPALFATLRLVEPVRDRHELATKKVSALKHFREAFVYMRKNKILRRLSIVQIMQEGFSTFALWPAFYNTLLPLGLVGVLYSCNFLESALGFKLSPWFSKRFKPMQILLGSELYSKAFFFPALLFPSPATPFLMAIASAPYGPATVAMGTVLHEHYTDHQRATMASITSFLGNCLYAVFTLSIGLVADKWGVGRAILIGQICLLPILWLYWEMYKTERITPVETVKA